MAAEAGGLPATHGDAIRAHLAAALARRAAGRQGRVRTLLDARVAALRQPADGAMTALAAPGGAAQERPGLQALEALAARCAQQAPAHDAAPSAAAESHPELKSLRWFRGTWTRLAAEHRLAQSQAAQPGNAGPLNSQRLVHRALTLMQETSPEYLHHFMAYTETLMRLEPAPAAAAPAGKEAARAKGGRKPRRDTGG